MNWIGLKNRLEGYKDLAKMGYELEDVIDEAFFLLQKNRFDLILRTITKLDELCLVISQRLLETSKLEINDPKNVMKDLVTIQQTLQESLKEVRKKIDGKKKRIRTVPLGGSAVQKLKQQINVIGKAEWLFPSPYNSKKHISGKQIYNRLQKYLRATGIDSKPFHALRATCIKLCQKKGWKVEQTAKLVGDTIRVVQEHYTTPSSEELRQVAREKPII